MAAAGRSSLRKVDAFDDQQVLGLRGERIHRLARTEQAAEVTGHCRPKALRLHATRAAQAERSGKPSRNGSPIAIVPAPYKNARRLITLRRLKSSITCHLQRAYGTRRS